MVAFRSMRSGSALEGSVRALRAHRGALADRLTRRLRAKRRAFRDDESGVAALEFVIIAPVMFGLLLAGVNAFDIYRYAEIAERTTYTVADILSREDLVDTAALNQIHDTHVALLGPQALVPRTRIISVENEEIKKGNGKSHDPKKGKLKVAWAYDSASGGPVTVTTVPTDLVPEVAIGESVLIVFTYSANRRVTEFLSSSTWESLGARLKDDSELFGAHLNTAVIRPRYTLSVDYRKS